MRKDGIKRCVEVPGIYELKTFTEVIEARGVEKGSVRWNNLRTEYEYHLEKPHKQWGWIWHATFGLGDDPPNDLPLE